MLLLSGGIFALSAVNLLATRIDRRRLLQALGMALVTGVFVAAYTTYDAYGIRATPDPFTFLAWYFVRRRAGLSVDRARPLAGDAGPAGARAAARGAARSGRWSPS